MMHTEARQIAARNACMQQVNGMLARAAAMLPESREEQFNCQIHGLQTYRTFKRVDGTYRPAYCPLCEAEKREKKNILADACETERARCVDLRKMLNLTRPSDFEGKTLETYKPETPEEEKNLMVATRFAKRFSIRETERVLAKESNAEGWREINAKGLNLVGTFGTGKSHLAYAILHELDAQGIPGFYTTVPDLLAVLTNRYAQVDRVDAMKKLCACACLVLDEVGVQKGGNDERQLIYQLIDGRMKNGRPTVFITNLDKVELLELLTERVMSRVRDSGYALSFTGRNRRESVNRTTDPSELF